MGCYIPGTEQEQLEMLKSIDLMNITPSGAIAILEKLKDAAEKM